MLAACSVVKYKGRYVLMYRWEGSNVWLSMPLS